jgi:hypothetical protein
MDFVWRERKSHLAKVCAEHPRVPGAFRLVLLHDPSAFIHLPEGEADLVLSGHTHGGQVGLVSLGLLHSHAGFRESPRPWAVGAGYGPPLRTPRQCTMVSTAAWGIRARICYPGALCACA